MWLPPCPIEACKDTEPEWGAWTQADLGYIHLNKGINTIKLNPIASAATNLDYFTLYCETEIS